MVVNQGVGHVVIGANLHSFNISGPDGIGMNQALNSGAKILTTSILSP
jgi:hypothetical protein